MAWKVDSIGEAANQAATVGVGGCRLHAPHNGRWHLPQTTLHMTQGEEQIAKNQALVAHNRVGPRKVIGANRIAGTPKLYRIQRQSHPKHTLRTTLQEMQKILHRSTQKTSVLRDR